MNTSTWLVTACAVMGVASMAACGNSTSSTGKGGTSSGTGGAASSTTASGMTAGTGGATTSTTTTATTGTGGAPACSGATPVSLTVMNVSAWCMVSVAGGTPSGADSQTVCVAAGPVTLDATAEAGFELGKWFGTTGDTGTGDPGTVTGAKSEATVTASAPSKCVAVCCPFSPGGNGCPTTNSCPP
jgi:hypothetical protein